MELPEKRELICTGSCVLDYRVGVRDIEPVVREREAPAISDNRGDAQKARREAISAVVRNGDDLLGIGVMLLEVVVALGVLGIVYPDVDDCFLRISRSSAVRRHVRAVSGPGSVW